MWHFRPFFNFDNFRREVHGDVISSVIVDPTGVKVRVKFGDSRSNRSRDIRLPHFVHTTTTPAYAAGHHVRAKRRKAFLPKNVAYIWRWFYALFCERKPH